MPLLASKPSTQASPTVTPLSFWRVVSLGLAVVFFGFGIWALAVGAGFGALWFLAPATLWGYGALGPAWSSRLACGLTGVGFGLIAAIYSSAFFLCITLLMLLLAVRPDPQRTANTAWQKKTREIVRAESRGEPGALSEAGIDHRRGALSDPV